MNFLLTGFSNDQGFRVFAFEGVAEDNKRTDFSVRADLALIRGYGIRVQELPLLCRDLLERSDEVVRERPLTFTGEHMRLHAEVCAAELAAVQKRRPKYRPPPNPARNPGPGPEARPEEHA